MRGSFDHKENKREWKGGARELEVLMERPCLPQLMLSTVSQVRNVIPGSLLRRIQMLGGQSSVLPWDFIPVASGDCDSIYRVEQDRGALWFLVGPCISSGQVMLQAGTQAFRGTTHPVLYSL